MSDRATTVYRVKTSGFWNTRHEFSEETDEGLQRIGVLTVKRGKLIVVEGDYQPEKGEVLEFRRDPGLSRSQFSLWTDGREWLGSSLRWSTVERRVDLFTGNKPLRLLPIEGLRFGWSLYAPKSGEVARIEASPYLGRSAKVEVYRRLDFPLLMFAYFLGSQIYPESFLPGPQPDKVKAAAAATAV
ncbi:hypothetical protein [Engelhardtia mirabilis]|uniref:Uncharacterized protein n=1 Tax=Engelhardtia mirabilis TaxID=2528011 RepID=A0A518BQ59_9BACT|nr:hypothetical protein Pla133_42190 [Planctomycetes bacterium Pla133]QDV03430.1 hypothetical protein Pla86_42180 [Planctomycetes bacterium Pla86]